jgi:hypothetical protein
MVAASLVDSALADSLKRLTSSEILVFVRDTSNQPQVRASTLPGLQGAPAAIGADTSSRRVELDGGNQRWVGAIGVLRTRQGFRWAGWSACAPGSGARAVRHAATVDLGRTGAGLILALVSRCG